jgi:hypothetical protein
MRTEDYTRLPIGTKAGKGDIQTCPHCGRRGIAEKVYERMFFTHAQWFGFSEDGHPEVGWDMCPKEEISLSTSPPK